MTFDECKVFLAQEGVVVIETSTRGIASIHYPDGSLGIIATDVLGDLMGKAQWIMDSLVNHTDRRRSVAALIEGLYFNTRFN